MSGASAVASARRRRAEPTPTITKPKEVPNIEKKNINENPNNRQTTITPLQILEIHDKKLNDLEGNLEEKIVNISKKVLTENLKHYNLDKLLEENKDFDTSSILENINSLTIKLDELKTLVIKSQQISNESNVEVIRLKDKVLNIENNISQLETNLTASHENKEDFFNSGENNSLEALLKTMMQGGLMDQAEEDDADNSRLNIHENESDEDINALSSVTEITLNENELNSLKEHVISDIKSYTVKLEEGISGELINVSENENEEEEEIQKEE